MIETQPLAVEDFSFGLTDFWLDGDPREAKTIDNLIITKNKKMRTRYGSEAFGDRFPTADKIIKLTQLESVLLAFQNGHGYFYTDTTRTEILGPTAGDFFGLELDDPVITDTEWRRHLLLSTEEYTSVQKLFVDGSGNYQVRNAGMPEIPAGVAITNPTGSGATYLYTFVLRYDYTNRELEYTSLGPTYLYPQAVTGGVITTGNGAAITLPTTISGAENFDTANFVLEIYRTQDGGDVFYKITSVPFGTSSYNDETEDGDLALNEQLYTTGGVLSYGTVPKCKYVHAVNDVGYYANIKETDGNIDETKVVQSSPGIVDAVPPANYGNTEQPIRGLSSIYDRPLVFCTSYVYRIDNFYDVDGSGGMALRRIDDNAGIVSQLSIVRTPIGIFWAGTGGFYWSDGLNVRNISEHLPTTYKALTQNEAFQKRIKGTFDKIENRVIWTVSLTETTEADAFFVLDLKFYQQAMSDPGHACFTSMSGGLSFRPTAVLQIGENLYRGDSRGYILRHRPGLLADVKVDETKDPSNWLNQTIIYDYESCFVDFGSKFYRKFVPRILISATNSTNLSLAISSSNDKDRVLGDLKPIRYVSSITWGDEFPLWGDANAVWNFPGVVEEWRRFPAGGLRCNYKQIKLTNAHTQIVTSDVLGSGTVDVAAKTVTLTKVPSGLEDYYIAFENDSYTREFLITDSTATTFTYKDGENLGPSANATLKYVIRGKPKGQVLELTGYVIHWAFISKSHTPYTSSSQGSTP